MDRHLSLVTSTSSRSTGRISHQTPYAATKRGSPTASIGQVSEEFDDGVNINCGLRVILSQAPSTSSSLDYQRPSVWHSTCQTALLFLRIDLIALQMPRFSICWTTMKAESPDSPTPFLFS
ncbi:predicted protein [Histoplasma capsulatum var. duboisii H88]|uniref:Predicted protein n=2 Tax=Ajellomyces capsulatus (strain H88) TaxID=544711 RepID=F0UMW3_AJEC8|nr:predicted protein [Histoplasma capsulatum var. duboisii H88]